MDKIGRKVNRRGYLVDRFGNVINTKGNVIFKAMELDMDDEIPAPFDSHTKRHFARNQEPSFVIPEQTLTEEE